MVAKVTIRLRAEVVKDEKGRPRLAFKNPAYYHQQVSQFRFDKYVMVTIENMRSERTPNQNRYWHGVCFILIGELTGMTEMEAKEVCVQMFIKPKIVKVSGKEYEIRRGTSELSKGVGVEFTNDIRQLAVELNGYIPTPCEAGYHCGRLDCKTCNPAP